MVVAFQQTLLWLPIGFGCLPYQHGDLPQTALTPARGCRFSTDTSLVTCRVRPSTVSTRRSSTDCTNTCTWLSLFNRHLSGYLSGSAVYRVNTEIFHRLHVHVVKGIYGCGMCHAVVCGSGMCQSSSTDTFLATCWVRPSTASTRRSSTDCTCTWLHVSVTCVRALQQTPSSAIHRVSTEIFHRLHVHVVKGIYGCGMCHVVVCGSGMCQSSSIDTFLAACQARPSTMSTGRSSTDCTCTWSHVALTCVRALQQTPGSAVQRVRTEIFHRLHVHVVACGCDMRQSSSTDTSQHGDLPHARGSGNIWLRRVSELFNRHLFGTCRARSSTASTQRSSTDCTNTSTWLCVAVVCVRAFQHTPDSAVHLVNTEIFHILH